MPRRSAITLGFVAAGLLTLTACTVPGTGEGDGTGTGSDDPVASGGIAGCLEGTWDLDGQHNADQIQEFFVANGTPVTSTETSGAVHMIVDGSTMTYESDISYVMTAQLDGGLEMIVSQLQTGESSGTWSVDGDEVVFADWVNGITVDTSVTIGGQAASVPIEIPSDSGAGVAMEVVCDGDTLSTHPLESPFTNLWTRAG
ncbi:MAG TPA: hypothetical protein VNS80_00030 [Pseudolysinimonas sp.]|nr:hypothetical protein [Pseudolysinimonas sp.]